MVKNLVIVESPAKAKTIEGFLGKDFIVKSSFGHIRDLPNKDLSVDLENNYEPNYVIPNDKKKIVSELKKIAKDAETIWLASDEDREGEAISWHLMQALKLDQAKTRRIVFNEITKNAILGAIDKPRAIDMNLVDAQQARRVLDRIVGYELSPVLWKKVKPSLSAGRVQSVAVRLIVEREREVMDFQAKSSYKITALFTVKGQHVLKAELPKRFDTREEAKAFLEECKGATFTITNLEKKPVFKKPSAPFTTSTLQQEASRKLGYSVSQTMTLAQKLYEAGKITYMRTDSVNLSDLAINAAKKEIISRYGDAFSEPRNYKTKTSGAQEAHEAIRPTYLNVDKAGNDPREEKLYELIWKRTVASQMAKAELEKTIVTIDVSTSKEDFRATGEVMKFEGFLKVYMESTDDEEESELAGILPPLDKGEQIELNEIVAQERFTHHPPRYTEASLVRKLEELGIGRPSTYAPTISTIQKRGYVVKEDRDGHERNFNYLELKAGEISEEVRTEMTGAERKKMFPTDIGMVVNDFLVEHFGKVLDFGFTAAVEEQFDEIARGQLKWNKMIDSFYKPFHHNVEDTLEKSGRAKGERELGVDPVTGREVFAKIGRFGPMVQMGSVDDEEKPKFASLRKNQSIQTITLEEALELFKLPRDLGEYEGEKITVAIGKYGPYVRHGKVFASIPEELDPMTIELPKAIELIVDRKNAKSNNIIHDFEDDGIQVLKGRYGPYIKFDKKNYKIPKDNDPEKLTLEDCKTIIESSKKK